MRAHAWERKRLLMLIAQSTAEVILGQSERIELGFGVGNSGRLTWLGFGSHKSRVAQSYQCVWYMRVYFMWCNGRHLLILPRQLPRESVACTAWSTWVRLAFLDLLRGTSLVFQPVPDKKTKCSTELRIAHETPCCVKRWRICLQYAMLWLTRERQYFVTQ